MEIPNYHLPSKILCIVVGVQLMVKVDTDEIFTLVTLFPLLEQQEYVLEDNHALHSPDEIYSFSKLLTSMETSTQGGLYIPKQHADRCFPQLDMTLQPPMQDLVVKDLQGIEWNFRHIYCDHERAHLLTNGWNTFVNSKNLRPGDSCIFVSGENGEIGIGIRRAMKQHSHICTKLCQQSSQNIQLGALAAVVHAVSIGSLFHLQYHPWIAPFEFMIPLKTYVESIEKDYSIGTRVHMLSEVGGCPRRYGTIVGNEDIDPIRWPGSEWRCIKVQWDSMLNIERVCPWWIEPLGSPKIMLKGIPIFPLPNKTDVPNPSLLGLNNFANENITGSSSKPEYHKVDMDLEGQQYNTGNDKKSIFSIFAFFICLCFFTFVIFVFRPLL
ncbi:auxin response factor 14 [Medicago truncatula]|nr:auxin response factor 14 [Medicago truncatula]